MRGKVISTVLLLLLPFILMAQRVDRVIEPSHTDSYKYTPKTFTENDSHLWLSFGPGIGLNGDLVLISSLGYQFRSKVLLLRAASYSDDDFGGSSDVGLLFGYGVKEPSYHATLALGLSRVEVQNDVSFFSGSEESASTLGLGVPLHIEYNYRLSPFHGIGLSLIGNINKSKSFGGIALLYHVGNLLEK